MKHDYLHGGYTRKYRIEKMDGTPVDPKAIYFVLRVDEDPCAREALSVYSYAVARKGNKELSDDIHRMIMAILLQDEDTLKCFR